MSSGEEFIPETLIARLDDDTLFELSRACLGELSRRVLRVPNHNDGISETQALGKLGLVDPFASESPSGLSSLADERLIINHEERTVTLDDRLLRFSRVRFRILAVLAVNADHVVSPGFLLKSVWGQGPEEDASKTKFGILRIRRLLGDEVGDTKKGVIRAIRGTGFIALSSLRRPLTIADTPTHS